MDDIRAWHDCHLCILCGPEIFASPVAKLLHVANMQQYSMFLQIFATSPALLQLLPHDHCSAVVAEDCRVMSHHHHLTFSPLFFSLCQYHLLFSVQLTLLVSMSFQVINFILSSSNYEMIMIQETRPGRPSQLLDRLGDVPLLPWFLLCIFI